jgi:hypothetical protein
MRTVIATGVVLALTSIGSAETIRGQVTDRSTAKTVEGAVVHVRGPDGETTVSTDADGRYKVVVPPGKYRLTFMQGEAAVAGTIVVTAGNNTTFDAAITSKVDEVIVLESRPPPAVVPEPVDKFVRIKVPPYSDEAILKDAWTRAWLLLDVDEHGKVSQVKFLKKPGYNLEPIALAEAWKLEFTPAKNDRGQAVPSFVLWPIEWPSMYYLEHHTKNTTRMPENWGLGRGSRAAWIACKGSGPWVFTNRISSYTGYRDCSRPDMAKAKTEPWIIRP